jgi:hypothetical protein
MGVALRPSNTLAHHRTTTVQRGTAKGPMSALGHVWTAPWQELSDVAAALVGCGHVSGLFVRR